MRTATTAQYWFELFGLVALAGDADFSVHSAWVWVRRVQPVLLLSVLSHCTVFRADLCLSFASLGLYCSFVSLLIVVIGTLIIDLNVDVVHEYGDVMLWLIFTSRFNLSL